MKTQAILYLDDLELVQCENGELGSLMRAAAIGQRPYMTFEFKERGAVSRRFLWQPCETRFFDPKR